MREDAALKVGIEFVFDELGQARAATGTVYFAGEGLVGRKSAAPSAKHSGNDSIAYGGRRYAFPPYALRAWGD